MIGAILNYKEGFLNPGSQVVGLINCHIQEMFFWMWRVRGIHFDFSISFDPDDEDRDDVEFSFSRNYVPILNTADPIPMTEAEQLPFRRGFGNQAGSFTSIPGDEQTFVGSFAGGASLGIVPTDERFGWTVSAGIRATLLPAIGTVSTIPFSNSIDSGSSIHVFAEDPVLGFEYEHFLPLYIPAGLEGTFSGSGEIYPNLFYEWRAPLTGLPFYDGFTGQQI